MNINEPNLTPERYKELDKKTVLIGIPHNLEMETKLFRLRIDLMKSFIGGEWIANENDSHYNTRNEWIVAWESDTRIEIMRNKLAVNAIENNYDYLLMIDSDMDKFPVDLPYLMMDKMEKQNIPILSGLCYTRPKFMNGVVSGAKPAGFMELENKKVPIETKPGSGIIKGKLYLGAACMMIKTDVFRNISFPYFSYQLDYNSEKIAIERSEDIYFCNNCISNGFEISLDTDLLIGHRSYVSLPYEYLNPLCPETNEQLLKGKILDEITNNPLQNVNEISNKIGIKNG